MLEELISSKAYFYRLPRLVSKVPTGQAWRMKPLLSLGLAALRSSDSEREIGGGPTLPRGIQGGRRGLKGAYTILHKVLHDL